MSGIPTDFDSQTIRFETMLGGAVALKVPRYQRSYAWESEEVTQLWEDLIDNWSQAASDLRDLDDLYFLGSVVTIPGAIGKRSLLLDGQQRIATITIMLAVIRDRLASNAASQGKKSADDLHRVLIEEKTALPGAGYQLLLNREDAEFFKASVQRFPKQNPKPTLKSHRRIAKAIKISEGKINDLVRNLTDDAQIELLDRLWRAIAGRIAVVNVSVTNEDDAGRIFEILNARGLELSLADLLRNFLVTQGAEGDRDEIARSWDEFIGRFAGTDLSPFLRHSWMSRYGDISKKNGYKTIRKSVHDGILTSKSFVQNTAQDADSYLYLLDHGTIDRGNRRLSDLVWGLNVLRAKQALPLLVVIHELFLGELKSTLSRVNALTFRYGVVGLNPNEFEMVYSRLAREARGEGLTAADVSAMIRSELLPKFPDDQLFEEKLASDYVVDRPDLQRYILWELERVIGDQQELAPLDPTKVNVEHIYPQAAAQKVPDLEPCVERLGNLTLLGDQWNKAASNKVFAEKKPEYKKSKFEITKEINTFEHWTTAELQLRQAWLASHASRTWSFD